MGLGGWTSFDDRPGMAIQRLSKSAEPFDRELALAELQVADLLIGRPQAPRQLLKRESAFFAELADAVLRRSANGHRLAAGSLLRRVA